MSIIELVNVVKTYKVLKRSEGLVGSLRDLFSFDYEYIDAVKDISFSINQGEIVGFLGPNGAGKSSTIKMMIGVLRPTSGSLVINGFDPSGKRESFLKNIGVVFGQRSQLWWDIPVIESFNLLKKIYEINEKDYRNSIKIYNEKFDFESLHRVPVRNLSLGQRILCDILAAFLHNPKVIFLDEPTIGLDISIKRQIRELIIELNRLNGTTVLITSHDTDDIEDVCNRLILIDKGNKIFDGKTAHFVSEYSGYHELKVLLSDKDRCVEGIKEKLRAACMESAISLAEISDGWISFGFNVNFVPEVNVLSFIFRNLNVISCLPRDQGLEQTLHYIYQSEARK